MTTQVMVLGGGYAGTVAANRLAARDDVRVTLVNPRAMFVDRIRLHQMVAGTHEATRDLHEVLHERVELVVDEADRIDVHERRVTLRGGSARRYDYLVYAVGSRGADVDVPGAVDHAIEVAELEQAQRLRDALAAAAPEAPVTVVGAGPTGIEVAAELAETGRAVTLLSAGALGPYLHERGRRAAASALSALGVVVHEHARATAVEADAVVLADGRRLPSAVTVWTAGFTTPPLARRSGLTTDAAGRLVTDETLTSVDDDRVVAAGDAADPSGLPLRMSCQAAIPLGAQAAATVLSSIDGVPPRPIDSAFVGQCVSIGRKRGIFQVARPDDRPVGVAIGGRAGAVIKELVCRTVADSVAKEARRPGSFRWPSSRQRRRTVAAARLAEPV